jgi:hypothetical protein
MIELKKNKFNFDSCTQGPFPGTVSNILIIDPGLDYKGLLYNIFLYFQKLFFRLVSHISP